MRFPKCPYPIPHDDCWCDDCSIIVEKNWQMAYNFLLEFFEENGSLCCDHPGDRRTLAKSLLQKMSRVSGTKVSPF